MDNDFLKELFELQNEFIKDRFDRLERKVDDHIESHAKKKTFAISNFLAPIITGSITGFVGVLIGIIVK